MRLHFARTLCAPPTSFMVSKFGINAWNLRVCNATTNTSANHLALPQENHKLVLEVKEKLNKEHGYLSTGKNGIDDEEMIFWFLKDRKFNVEETVMKLVKAISWRKEFTVDSLNEESIKNIASTGKAYLHKHTDVHGRPVVVVLVAKHLPKEQDLLESERLCVFLIEKALGSLPVGQDKILGIFDFRGFSLQNGDIIFAKFLIDVFYYYYPRRLGEVLFVEAPFIFQPGWNIVKPWLKSYANLVRFCSSDVVQEYFTPETVPQDFKDGSIDSWF